MRAAAKTLGELRVITRELADMSTDDPTTHFASDPQLDRRINEALRDLYNLLLQAYGHEYYVESRTLETVSGEGSLLLPRDFYRLLGVRASESAGTYWHPLDPFEYQDVARLESVTAGSVRTYRYRVRAETLAILPVPRTTGHKIRIDYIPSLSELLNEDEKCIPCAGWEKWACLTAAIDLATREENYELVQVLVPQRNTIQKQLEQLAGERDAARPIRIQDTRRDGWEDEGDPDLLPWAVTP